MPVKCSICSNPNRAAIDDLLDAGTNQKDVAVQFGVSKFALSRHARHTPEVEAAGGDSPAEIEKWLGRADDQYLLAVANADQRGAINALVAGLRAVEAQAKSEEREEEATPVTGTDAPVTGTDAPITIEEIDRIIQTTLNETERGRNQNRLYSAPDAVLEIAVRIMDNPSKLPAVKTILESQVN